MAQDNIHALDHYTQNIIKEFHTKLSAGFPLPPAVPGQTETRLPPHHFDTDKYLRPDDSDDSKAVIPVVSGAEGVGIIGGGIGGLYAALLLEDSDIKYTIYEADNRIGGRLYTYSGFPDRRTVYDYYDVGAMRFPDTPIMKPVFDLFRLLRLKLLDYYLVDRNSNSTRCFNDIVRQRGEGPILPQDYNIYNVPQYWGKHGVHKNVENVVRPFKDRLKYDQENGTHDGWALMMKYDVWSMRAYMAGNRSDEDKDLDSLDLIPYPLEVVEWCETFDHSTSSYDKALTEVVLDSLAFEYAEHTKWYCIDRGSSQLAEELNTYLKKKNANHTLLRDTRVTGIRFDREKNSVNVRTERGEEVAFGHVITTTTLPCLRAMNTLEANLDYLQKNALRSLQYGQAVKIGVKFKTAWWQNDGLMKKFGAFGAIIGGQSFTDYMSRRVVYPSYGVDDKVPSSVLIVSYASTGDALAWTGLTGSGADAMIKRRVLDDLVAVHCFDKAGRAFLEEQWEAMHPYSWGTDKNTMGAFAFFGPGQFCGLYTHLTRPAAEGRLHFAGEVMSARHAWVVGALQASHRAVWQIIATSYPSKLKRFEERWGRTEAWTRESLLRQVDVSVERIFPLGN
ncbi:uncharacterized protein PHACADRAFT_213099 [Phanerochaete carnosa HHB-10118-sp]|uniref:Amine oxidase domain-containing protein n=1 Tax=Phanerochaete carnosa (strain HHB-10118-sp) TaxID=650164 RepID=K5UNB8_PHACS|nr:uncharacterized protein PHACADRAFT_213099 [Phanerochaete carnosa HHB-10118-sp]EKM51231.1 hypothetical protein PHACADRAFT_213099 [Phanerochaete carnosa HHB-10118-sp]